MTNQFVYFAVAIVPLVFAAGTRAADSPVVLGGTCTMQDLLTPSNTVDFRAAGGGLYIHYNGWMQTLNNAAQRQTVWQEFSADGPAIAELGYSSPPANWTSAYQTNFVGNGVNVSTINVNGLVSETSGDTDIAGAEAYVNAFKSMGVSVISPVLSPNANSTDATTYPFASSYWNDQRTVALAGGGWTSDAPPSYFFARGTDYQNWIYAETQWANTNGLMSINIISNNTAGTSFFADSVQYVRDFEANSAIPKQWVVENYDVVGAPPTGYVNQIGSETNANNLAYTANWLINHVQGVASSLDLYGGLNGKPVVGQNVFSTNPATQAIALQSAQGTKTYTVDLSNLNTDATTGFYAPMLTATETGNAAGWSVQALFDGIDITSELLSGGFTLEGANILSAGQTDSLTLNITQLTGTSTPFDFDLLARANPDATVIADSLQFSSSVPEPCGLAALAAIAMLTARPRRLYRHATVQG